MYGLLVGSVRDERQPNLLVRQEEKGGHGRSATRTVMKALGRWAGGGGGGGGEGKGGHGRTSNEWLLSSGLAGPRKIHVQLFEPGLRQRERW